MIHFPDESRRFYCNQRTHRGYWNRTKRVYAQAVPGTTAQVRRKGTIFERRTHLAVTIRPWTRSTSGYFANDSAPWWRSTRIARKLSTMLR